MAQTAMTPTDLDHGISAAAQFLRTTSNSFIRWADLLDYYEYDYPAIKNVLVDCKLELIEMMATINKFTLQKEVKSLGIIMHRILGMACYLFADRLINVSQYYINFLSHADRTLEKKEYQITVSFNQLLQSTIDETIEDFGEFRKKHAAGRSSRSEENLVAMGMCRPEEGSASVDTYNSELTKCSDDGDEFVSASSVNRK